MDALAEVCERVANYSSRVRKVELLSEYFRGVDDADLGRAVHLLCCGPVLPAAALTRLFGEEKRGLSVGGAALRDALMAVTGWDAGIVRLCVREVGDAGETAGLLIRDHTRGEPMTLADAEAWYGKLHTARGTAAKVRLLAGVFRAFRPLAIKYFVKAMSGDLRIGVQARLVEEAIAAACGAKLDEVRAANHRLGDLSAVAVAARRGELHRIEAALFHPMEFMLAKPLDAASDLPDPAAWMVEDKYDGIRAQAHFGEGRVAIYTRGREDVTHAYPEIAAEIRKLPGSGVLDGELLAWRDGRAMAFTVLQQRLARKRVAADLVANIPVVFIAYDMLYRNGGMLVDREIENRRAELEESLGDARLPVMTSGQYRAETTADIERLFEEARLRGNEGLLLKRRGSVYEPGERSGAWWKLKRQYATLDVAITAAEQGTGKRATVLSAYTFAVRSENGFANVGKAYSGLTDVEVRELTRILRASSVDRFGRVVLVKPEVVLEVAFDGVQKSPRHKGGYALRFPRIVRWRKDRRAEQCDDLDRVRLLYESSLNLTAPHE